MRATNIAIDADGSPLGYISWHNHLYNKSKIRVLKPSIKNEKFGVQRMEMLAIYFAISDNLRIFKKIKRRKKTVIVRSDSKSTIELLNRKTGIRDIRIFLIKLRKQARNEKIKSSFLPKFIPDHLYGFIQLILSQSLPGGKMIL